MKAQKVIFLLWLVLLSGCSLIAQSKAVEQLRPVETMGYDVDGPFVTVSASSGADRPLAVAARGGSIPQAMENLRSWSDAQELFFAHVRYVAAGEQASRAGLGELLDWYARSTQTSLETPLLVVRGGEARALVTASAGPEREISALLASMQRDAEQTGTARCFTMREISKRLDRSGAALCCAVEARPLGANAPAEEGQAVLCAGYAVLKNAALVGFLDADTALGADLIMDLAGQADYVLPCGVGRASVTLLKSKTELSAERGRRGELILSVITRLRAGILSTDGVDAADPDQRRALAEALSKAAAAQEAAALAASRNLGADFLELRKTICKYVPSADASDFLRTLRWQVQVIAEIERSYDLDGDEAYG